MADLTMPILIVCSMIVGVFLLISTNSKKGRERTAFLVSGAMLVVLPIVLFSLIILGVFLID